MLTLIWYSRSIARGSSPRLVGARVRFAHLDVFLPRQSWGKNIFYFEAIIDTR